MAGRFCSACRAPADSGESRFCGRCGRPLAAAPFLPPSPPPYASPTYSRTPPSTGTTVALVLGVGIVVLVLVASVYVALRPLTPVPTGCCPGSYFPGIPSVVVPQGTNYALAPGAYVDALLVGNQSLHNGTGSVASNLTEVFGVVESAGSSPLLAFVLTAGVFANWSTDPGANVSAIFAQRANGSQLLTVQASYPTAPAYLVLWDPSTVQSSVVTVIESVTVMAFTPPPPVPV